MFSLRKVFMKPAAVLLSAVMLVGGSFVSSSYDHTDAESNSITYIKHYYNSTKPDEEYSLTKVDRYPYAVNALNEAGIYSNDPRPNATSGEGIVNIADCATGFIIGKHEIMTASHVVYYAEGHQFSDIQHIYVSGTNAADHSIDLTPVSCHITKEFKTQIDNEPNVADEPKSSCDFAIIVVEEDLTNYGILPLGIANSDSISNKTSVHTLGYYFRGENVLKHERGNLVLSKNFSDFYYLESENMYTFMGSSGGPIYFACKINGETYVTVIGVTSLCWLYTERSGYAGVTSDILKFAYDNDYL